MKRYCKCVGLVILIAAAWKIALLISGTEQRRSKRDGSLEKANAPSRWLLFITAADSSHFNEVLLFLRAYKKSLSDHELQIWDLGLKIEHKEILTNITFHLNVSVVNATARIPPETVYEGLTQYRWKPLLIQESLKSTRLLIYADTSIRFKSSSFLPVLEKLGNSAGNNTAFNEAVAFDVWSNRKEFRDFHRRSRKCRKPSPVFLFGASGTSIYAATAPEMYKGLGISNAEIEQLKSIEMYDANLIALWNTEEARSLVSSWAKCAVHRTCLAPPLAMNYCDFGADRHSLYKPPCHRFDQSALNLILLQNWEDFSRERMGKSTLRYCYVARMTGFYEIERL